MKSIHPDTTIGAIHLTVTDLRRSIDFYRDRLGFQVHRRDGDTAVLSAGRRDLVVLNENPAALRHPRRTGLYHFAIRVPSRRELARSLRRIGSTDTRVEGFADHLVSEAVYLSDPDGNGIEIYRDRPRNQWLHENGQLKMATDPLDLDGIMAELAGQPEPDQPDSLSGLAPDTDMGHMHLHVSHIKPAERFYGDVLGFDLMMQYGPSASFLSAGGYHHHLGLNTWNGEGAPPPPAEAIGLRYFEIVLPEPAALDKVIDRVRKAGLPLNEVDTGYLVRDPSQNGILLTDGGA